MAENPTRESVERGAQQERYPEAEKRRQRVPGRPPIDEPADGAAEGRDIPPSQSRGDRDLKSPWLGGG